MRKCKKLVALVLAATMLVLETVPANAAIDENTTVVLADEEEIVIENGVDEFLTEDSAFDESFENEQATLIAEEKEELEDKKETEENGEDEEKTVMDATEIAEILPGIDDAFFCEKEEIIADKEMMSEHLSDLEGLISGINYASDEIIVSAENEEEARMYADAFAGTLIDCEYGYALIRLNTDPDVKEVSVKDVVFASTDCEIALPAAWPNYYGEYLDDYSVGEEIIETDSELETYSEFETYRYNDPCLRDSNENYQWQHYLMQTNKAWQAGYTGNGVSVAVIDSGVYNGHEDISLKGFYKWNGSDMVSAEPSDDNGHGSHCTGIVGAKANNGRGGCGIAPNASLYAFRISTMENDTEVISMYAVGKSINKAVETLGVNVISISIGSVEYSKDLESAVNNAYDSGVAVFVASGNDSSSTILYPATFDKAIAVAAVNQNNAITSFSNVSSKVRYTGPGYQIYSTYNKGSNSYTMMNGTSQATPCVAGAAALFLSSGQVTGTGKEKVENLLKLMDKSCVSSGVGKGTPNLAKGLGLASSTTAPLPPVAKILNKIVQSSVTKAEVAVSVSVSAEAGAKIYYTVNNGSIKYKDGVLSDNAIYLGETSGSIKISGAASNTLKLIAVSSENGLASKEASYTIKLEPKVSSVEITAANDVNSVSRGAAIQLTAKVTPSYAKNKAVTWQFADGTAPAGVTLSSAGKLSTKANSTVKSVKIRATAKDGSGASGIYTVNINDPLKIKSVKATPASYTVNDGETVTPVILTTYNDNTTSEDASIYKWTSSNESIASCTCSSDKKLSIKGISIGKTTITGIDKSGQGKKITISVTVNQRISNITVSGYERVAQGKSIKVSADITPAKVTDKKLNWEIKSVPAGTTASECGVTINKSSGVISTKATAVTGDYTVKVTANDAGKKTAEFKFTVISSSLLMRNMNLSAKEMRIYRVTNSGKAATTGTFTVSFENGSTDNLTVLSNAPGIATASISGKTVTVKATGMSTGNVKITVMSTDGSNLKKECKVVVVNPPTKLYLTAPKGRSEVLAYNKTLKLNPVFVTENGVIDAKARNLEWSSSDTNYLTVDKSGNVKAVNIYGKDSSVTITAKTTDGSNLTATFDIYPNGYVYRMSTGGLQYDTASAKYYCSFYTIGYEYGVIYNAYQVTVSGPKNVLMGKMISNRFYIFDVTQKGTYTITVKRNDGSNLSASAKVIVR